MADTLTGWNSINSDTAAGHLTCSITTPGVVLTNWNSVHSVAVDNRCYVSNS